jgi:hypothetical protein
MRPLRPGILAMAAAPMGGPSMAFLGTQSLVQGQTITVNNVNIGTPGNRVIIITTYVFGLAVPASATINGIAATTVTIFQSTRNLRSTIYYAYVPTGTSATVVMSYNTSANSQWMAVYAVYDLASAVAYATQTMVWNTNNPTGVSTSVNVAAPGFAFGTAFTADTAPYNFGASSGLTVNASFSGNQIIAASAPTPSSGALTWSIAGNFNATSLVMASFG